MTNPKTPSDQAKLFSSVQYAIALGHAINALREDFDRIRRLADLTGDDGVKNAAGDVHASLFKVDRAIYELTAKYEALKTSGPKPKTGDQNPNGTSKGEDKTHE